LLGAGNEDAKFGADAVYLAAVLVFVAAGGGKGIAIGGNITTRSVELRADSLDLSGTISGDGDPAGTAKVWTLSDGKTINFGTGTGGLDLAGNAFKASLSTLLYPCSRLYAKVCLQSKTT